MQNSYHFSSSKASLSACLALTQHGVNISTYHEGGASCPLTSTVLHLQKKQDLRQKTQTLGVNG